MQWKRQAQNQSSYGTNRIRDFAEGKVSKIIYSEKKSLTILSDLAHNFTFRFYCFSVRVFIFMFFSTNFFFSRSLSSLVTKFSDESTRLWHFIYFFRVTSIYSHGYWWMLIAYFSALNKLIVQSFHVCNNLSNYFCTIDFPWWRCSQRFIVKWNSSVYRANFSTYTFIIGQKMKLFHSNSFKCIQYELII